MLTLAKNQIRPRSTRARFDNDEIIAMSNDLTDRVITLPVAKDEFIFVDAIILHSHIEAIYTMIDAVNPFFFIHFPQGRIAFIEDVVVMGPPAQTLLGVTSLLAPSIAFSKDPPGDYFYPVSNMALATFIGDSGFVYVETSTVDNVGQYAAPFTFPFGTGTNNEIEIMFDNGGSALTGGDPGNFLDVLVYAWAVKL